MIRPVKGRLLFRFGAIYPRPWPWWAKKDGEHDGGDYECYREPVVAPADGKVIEVAFEDGGYGNYVRLDHGGKVKTLCAHLSSVSVNAGQYVEAGQVIGISGDSGSAEGMPHLHFEVEVDGERVDPEEYFAKEGPPSPSPSPWKGEGEALPMVARWNLQEDVVYLNVRAGPGVQYADVGDLAPGQVVDSVEVGGEDIWIKLAPEAGQPEERWCAVQHGGVRFLEMVVAADAGADRGAGPAPLQQQDDEVKNELK